MAVVIDLHTINNSTPKEYVVSFSESWWKDDPSGQILGLASPVDLNVIIYKTSGNKFVVEGNLKGKLYLNCDRCLDKYTENIVSDFSLFFSTELNDGKDNLKITDTDLDLDFAVDGKIDLSEIAREQIFVIVPMKSLCSDSCKGICHCCGNNLNVEQCDCNKMMSGHPAFRALNSLKLKE